MDIEDSCKMRFQHTSVGDNHEFLIKNHNGVDPFNGSGWDQLVSLNRSSNVGHLGSSVVHQSEIFNSHYPVMYDHQAINVSSHMISKIPSFGCSQIVGDEPADSSANVKRKRNGSESHSLFNSRKSCEGNLQKVSSRDTSECLQEQEEKEKIKQQSKRSGKQVNTSNSGEQPKSDYVHMRAKRGQATNSHSLAERVRRERISERMRLLQELVPGCNEITGKAMMLEEIINYVQSLQNHVEFLSMKLATVNPELNLDIERLLSSKDVFHGRAASSAALALPPGLRTSQFSAGIPQGNFICGAPNMPQLYPLPQMVWDGEFQSDSSNGNRFSSIYQQFRTKWELKDWNNYNSI